MPASPYLSRFERIASTRVSDDERASIYVALSARNAMAASLATRDRRSDEARRLPFRPSAADVAFLCANDRSFE
jgi:hypothetical protein